MVDGNVEVMHRLHARVRTTLRDSLRLMDAGALAPERRNLEEITLLAELCRLPDRRLLGRWLEAAQARALAREARARSSRSRARSRRLRTRAHIHVVRTEPPAGP